MLFNNNLKTVFYPCCGLDIDSTLNILGEKSYNFIFCDMVHNEAHYKHYNLLEASLSEGNIDMGCFATKTKYSKRLKLDVKKYTADWIFAEKYITLYPSRINHIKKALYVHN